MLPSVIYLALVLISLGMVASKHGQPAGRYNFVTSLIAMWVVLAILAWGGFFDALLAAL